MDGWHCFKVREGSKVISKTIFLTLGPTEKDKKEDLGMRLGKYESSSFWMNVLTDLKASVVEDRSVFPKSKTQIGVVHQIRNACKHVAWKNRKQFTADMKLSYRSNQTSYRDDFKRFYRQMGK